MTSKQDIATWSKRLLDRQTYRPRMAHPKHVTHNLHPKVARQHKKANNRKTTNFTQLKHTPCPVVYGFTQFHCEQAKYSSNPHTFGQFSTSH